MDDSKLQSQSANASASLTQRFRSGDDAAFDQVIIHFGPPVRNLVHRLLGRNGECEDVVQDVFVAALAGRHAFKAAASLKTWLFVIAVNRCRTYRRRQVVRGLFRRQMAMQTESCRTAGTECDRSEQMRRALNGLPGKYRDVLILKYLEELPTPDILRILKIRESTLYTRLHRAKKQLREKLLLAEDT